MHDMVVPLLKEGRTNHPRKGEYYVRLPMDFYGMQGVPGTRVYLKTHDRAVATDRLASLAVVAQLTNPAIKEF